MRTLKQKASDWMSKYVRLRDALDYCWRMGIDLTQFKKWNDLPVDCCYCGKIIICKKADAAHYYSRGIGGGSGAYFDERNVNTSCKSCNAFGGDHRKYGVFMLEKYGPDILDKLEILHKSGRTYTDKKLIGLALFYKGAFEGLRKQIGI